MAGATYDPDQDPEERRGVRKSYRSLAKAVEEQQGNLNEYSAQDLTDQIHKADELFTKVRGPQEATLDSAFLLMASNMGAQKARAMKSGSGSFDVEEFLSKLVTFMGGAKLNVEDESDGEDVDSANGTRMDWDRIGRKALAKSRRVPAMGFMLGPLSIEHKTRTVGKRAKFEKNKAEERKPQELKEEDIARSENETTKNVATLEALLEDEGRINLFKFVINPDDFAQSVENIFYLSFLIRDGKVALETDEDGQVMIFICMQPADEDYVSGLKKRQMVFEFDKATWQRAKEVFEITESKIPQRPAARTRLGDKWYG
ncbi:Nse4 C-terminal-domain-containing protein [Mycena rosella]|uniref:Non-structural maintenance of chromosomes element 4 n=1 Tax=Mycena rosella TaxID=1033263 RepID=A0AAD7GQD5_MYCRO|nr:Nse4 C-terminal-domain-containing protein [Mycena rosella]